MESAAELPRFLDRESSWLQFNSRVLELAEDKEVPLLERAKFAAIFANNLDEFFMVRVAGLKRRIATGAAGTTTSGLTYREVLQRIWAESRALMTRHAQVFQEQLRPELVQHGIEILRWSDLDTAQQEQLYALFRERIFPVLTPLAVDPAHPFPYISGLSLNLAVVVRNPVTGNEHFARVKVPPLLPRFVEVSDGHFMPLEELIAVHLPHLFNGMEVLGHHTFRVTRNEDVEVEGDESQNLLETLERELVRRRFGPPVRLEVEETIDPAVLELLVRELDVSEQEVFGLPTPLDLTGLFTVAGEDRPELKFPPFATALHRDLAEYETNSSIDVFAAMRQRDILLHHPYDSFTTSVQAFLEQAAEDPDVRAIKQTLYRTSGESPIVDALVDAAEAGKEVLVLVEIKARFDEHANIVWARKLEQAGCHVVYGLMGLKTHCKLSLVVRQEGNRLRRYAHIGTGNYKPEDRAAVRGPGPADHRPERRRGSDAPVQPAVRLLAHHDVPQAADGAQRAARRADRADRPGAGEADQRPARGGAHRADPDEDELAGGRGGHRRALRGVPGGRAHRRGRARDVRAAARRAGTVRDHQGPQRARPVPRTLAGLRVRRGAAEHADRARQHRAARGVDRLGGHDAPQPGPAGRGPGAADRPGAPARADRADRHGLRGRRGLLGAGAAGRVAAPGLPGRTAAAGRAGVADRRAQPVARGETGQDGLAVRHGAL